MKLFNKITNNGKKKGVNLLQESGILPPDARSANAAAILEQVARKNELNSPYEIFELGREEKIKLQAQFVKEARKGGCADEAIGWELIRAQYPAKIKNYKPTNVDQACAQEILGSDEVDWTALLSGGKSIVENGVSLGGTFGKITTPKEYMEVQCAHNPMLRCNESSSVEVQNEVADALYLLEHAQHANLPQPPYIMFGEYSAGGEGDFEKAKKRATGHRASFKRHVSGIAGNIDRKDHLKISNTAHGGTSKYRMLCTVLDGDTGALMVVSEKNNLDGSAKRAIKFADWVKTTDENGRQIKLKDLLSADDAELEIIHKIVFRPGGLLEQIQNPKNGRGYAPWESLKNEVKAMLKMEFASMRQKMAAGDGIGTEGKIEKEAENNKKEEEDYVKKAWYKKACKIWKYAIMMDRADNALWYEKNWDGLKIIKEVKDRAARSFVCDDSRQKGDIKVLGAFLSESEFNLLVGDEKVKRLAFVPHYQCGFLSAAHDIHKYFERLGKILKNSFDNGENAEFSEYGRAMEFFGNLIRNIKRGSGTATEINVLNDYLPDFLVDELNNFRRDRNEGVVNHSPNENYALAKFLFDVFVDNREKTRAVIRRGIETRVLAKSKNTGLLFMPAADKVYERLEGYFPGEYKDIKEGGKVIKKGIFSDSQINNLIIEQAARSQLGRYEKWLQERGLEGKIKIMTMMENFYTGQFTILPKKPHGPNQLKNLMRQDFFLSNGKYFQKQDLYDLRLEKRAQWEIPA